LDLARRHQTGRVTENVTTVTFTEGWFRHRSGNRQRTSKREGGEKIRHGGFHRTLVPRQWLICPMRKVPVTDVLGLAKKHQTGRVTEKVTNVTFTEGWFRDSGGRTS